MVADKDMVTFSIQVPVKMHERLRKLARAEDRGLGPQVRVILSRYLPEAERESAEAAAGSRK